MRTTFVSQRARWCSPDFPPPPRGDSDGPAPKQRVDDGDRTRDLHLGKVPRYQLRYIHLVERVNLPEPAPWCTRPYTSPCCNVSTPVLILTVMR